MYGVLTFGCVVAFLNLFYSILRVIRTQADDTYRKYLEGYVAHTQQERTFVRRRLRELTEQNEEAEYHDRLVFGTSLTILFFTLVAVAVQLTLS